jgi:hypothetical protein
MAASVRGCFLCKVQFSIPSFLGAALKNPGFVCTYAKHFDSTEKLLFYLFDSSRLGCIGTFCNFSSRCNNNTWFFALHLAIIETATAAANGCIDFSDHNSRRKFP